MHRLLIGDRFYPENCIGSPNFKYDSVSVSFFQIMMSVLQDTNVMSMLCVIIPKDPTIATVTKVIMETEKAAQVIFFVAVVVFVVVFVLLLLVCFCHNRLISRLTFYLKKMSF